MQARKHVKNRALTIQFVRPEMEISNSTRSEKQAKQRDKKSMMRWLLQVGQVPRELDFEK